MYLRKLEIQGFKSFAKKTVLEFEPGITSVVGPNGSGKSNIADSLRWVFGEQSMKLLRSKRAEDVIFAGSDQKARLGAAEIQVTFDNTDRIMPLDYGEVVITRRVFRDGASEYIINGNTVRLLDIEELMAKSGFAHSSYHVIGQGMIDQLILGGPAAVKELLEEASGVKPYYMKRDQTLRKLERTRVNLEQARALIAEIEPRLRSLRRQAKRFEKRADVEAELKTAQALHYGQIFAGLQKQSGEMDKRVSSFEAAVGKLTGEIDQLKKDIEKQEGETQSGSQAYKKLRDDVNLLHKQKLKLQEEQALLRGKLRAEGAAAATFAPNWGEIKNQFRLAYDALRRLLKNFTPEGAKEVEKLFADFQSRLEGVPPHLSSPTSGEELKEGASQELKKLGANLEKIIAQIQQLETDLEQHTKTETEMKQQLFVKERLLRNKQDALVKLSEQKNQQAVEQARIQTRMENYDAEARAALGPDFEQQIKSVLNEAVPHDLADQIAKLQRELSMIGGVDDLLVQEYKETEERFQYLTTQSQDLEKGVNDLHQVIVELDEVIKKDFQEAFVKISEKFSEYFRILFGGGKATMNMLREDSQIIGIEIRATPPGKKLAGIAALSGGERALTAIALLSSILATYPSPFVVLDEVDAALDEANSVRFGKIVGTLASKTQFITITHNRETMRQSHTLYGVTMGDDGVSKLLSLKLEQATAYSTKK